MNAGQPDPALGRLIGEAREELATESDRVRPRGFQDVLDRVAALRGDAGEAARDRSESVVPLRGGGSVTDTRDPELEAFVADARTALDARIGGRRRSRFAWGLAGVAAVAAGILFVVVPEVGLLVRHDRGADMDQSPVIVVPTPRTGRAHTNPRRRDPAEDVERTEVVPEPPQAVATETDITPQTRSTRRRARSEAIADPPRLEDRLKALDEQAQAQWREGDRAAAEATYRVLVELAGRHHYAQLAFADLFTLLRQGGQLERLTEAWHEYLNRFPEGRFADDARAGLCRAAPSPGRAECWQRYRFDFPHGSYRGEADRALASQREEKEER